MVKTKICVLIEHSNNVHDLYKAKNITHRSIMVTSVNNQLVEIHCHVARHITDVP